MFLRFQTRILAVLRASRLNVALMIRPRGPFKTTRPTLYPVRSRTLIPLLGLRPSAFGVEDPLGPQRGLKNL